MEQLRQSEFDTHVKSGTLRLAFVGMSNVGKSMRAKSLAQDCNFFHYNVDTHIADDLGFADVRAIGKWLGYPDGSGYKEREKKYLELENLHTNLGILSTGGKSLVFDTTGSVVYLPDETTKWLKNNTLIVYLVIDKNNVEEMTERFFENIKPLIWGDMFVKEEGQSTEEAIRRSYPSLLHYRAEKYAGIAHLTIPADLFWNTNGIQVLDIVKQALPE
ncbi:MAG: hypothetical protein H8D63_03350 [Parcubacteria group bacterium]|nr:hypothetical protein [Parcubacteria group bacterium]